MTDDPLIMVLDSPWFWVFFAMLGVYIHSQVDQHDEWDLILFKDFTIMWLSFSTFLLGFSLQYSITYGLLAAGMGGGSWTQTVYFLIFVGIAIWLGWTLVKSEERTDTKIYTQFMQIIIAFSLGAVFRVIYEMGMGA